MTERPILFSGPMVRAILAGQKTVTRRVAKMTATGTVKEPRGHRRWHPKDPDVWVACPYGVPGDTLWVRETWGSTWQAGEHRADAGIVYRATDPDWDTMTGWRWRPSIHMPRWASRLTLRVTSVRVERLQDITESDARLEGITDGGCANPRPDARDGFAGLWHDLNGYDGPNSWHANPYVWRIGFEVVT